MTPMLVVMTLFIPKLYLDVTVRYSVFEACTILQRPNSTEFIALTHEIKSSSSSCKISLKY